MSQNSIASEGSKSSRAIVAGSKNHSQITSVRSGRARPQGVEHHVVGVQRDERVREQRRSRGPSSRSSPREAVDRRARACAWPLLARHRRGALAQGHRAAAPGAVAAHLLAAHVVAERVELRVDAGAVQALVVVLGDRPSSSRRPRRSASPARASVADAVALEVAEQLADVLARSSGASPREVDQDQARRRSRAGPAIRPQQEGSKSSTPSMCGAALQLAVEAVGPGVVGARSRLADAALGAPRRAARRDGGRR